MKKFFIGLIGVLFASVTTFSLSSCGNEEYGEGDSNMPFVGVWKSEHSIMDFGTEHTIEFKSDRKYYVTTKEGPKSGIWNYDEITRVLALSSTSGNSTWIVMNYSNDMLVLMNAGSTSTITYNRAQKNTNPKPTKKDDTEKIKRIEQQIKQHVTFSAKEQNLGYFVYECTLKTTLGNTIEGENVKYGVMSGNNEGVRVSHYYNYNYFTSDFYYQDDELEPSNFSIVPYITGENGGADLYADYQDTLDKYLGIYKRLEKGEPVSDEELSWAEEAKALISAYKEAINDVFWAEIYVQVGNHKYIIATIGRKRENIWNQDENSLFYSKWKPIKRDNYDLYGMLGYPFNFTGNITEDKGVYDAGYYYDLCHDGTYAGVWKYEDGNLMWHWTKKTASEHGKLDAAMGWGGEIVMFDYNRMVIHSSQGLIYFERVWK